MQASGDPSQHDTPTRRRGFPPVLGPRVRVLVLGSFPGTRSLASVAYYANAQNRFWRAVADVAPLDPTDSYPARLAALRRAGIGLWDVLRACRREGSLDQRIVPGSEEPNDLGPIVRAHPELRAIVLNGGSVAGLFHRFIVPRPWWPDAGLAIRVLPSTSPAHAAMPAHEVVARWSTCLRELLAPGA